jgi:hypothetical protein
MRIEKLVAVVLQPYPPAADQPSKPIRGLLGERLRAIVSARALGRVDAEQPHSPDSSDVDRVAIDDVPDEDRVGAAAVSREGDGKNCNA